jgi:hypothetical protein
MRQAMQLRAKQYGPIYRETIGTVTSVVITDLDEYAKIIHADGRFPNRLPLMPFLHYEQTKKKTIFGAGSRLASELCYPLAIKLYLKSTFSV